MKTKAITGIMLTLLLIGTSTLAFNIQPVKASGTICIRADGSIDPPTAPITSLDNVTYTFTSNVGDSIVVERDNIVVNGAGYAVEGNGSGVGLFLSKRTGVTIRNMTITEFRYGIFLWGSSGNTLSDNTFSGVRSYSIRLDYYSSYNRISGNNITNGYSIGIFITRWSTYNKISANSITNNSVDGLWLSLSSNNTISGNKITNNGRNGINLDNCGYINVSGNSIINNQCGIQYHYAPNNIIYHNNFVDNTEQAYCESYASLPNTWDDGYPSGGNYWSDYEERYPDAQELGDSGIWDTPYFIDKNNQDNYPLMEPWSPKPSTPPEALEEMIEAIETWNLPKGTEISLTLKLEAVLWLLVQGNENGAIHKLTDFIKQVEAQRGKSLTDEQADQLIAEAQRIIDLIEG